MPDLPSNSASGPRIAHHGEYHGVGKRITETFADRYHHQNKVVPSLEDAIRLTGLRDGMTISFTPFPQRRPYRQYGAR